MNKELYHNRRQTLMQKLGSGVLILGSNHHVTRNSDVHYSFRQESDFFYLTGFTEGPATLILHNQDNKITTTLVVPKKDKEVEIWNGFRHGVEGAISTFGADQAWPNEELEKAIHQSFDNQPALFFDFNRDPNLDSIILKTLEQYRSVKRKNPSYPEKIVFFRKILGEMRQIKSQNEIDAMQKCVDVTRDANLNVLRELHPGMNECEVAAILEYNYMKHGGTHGYGHIVAGGNNATCLHYHDNNQVLKDGDLLLIDSGCELDALFTADVTRCYPVNGKFNTHQKEIYELVLKANKAAIEQAVVGSSIANVHKTARITLAKGLIELGLLKGEPEALIDTDLKKFYMHGTSHWLGMDVHDTGTYETAGEAIPFKAGMALTIEPGLYFNYGYSGVETVYEGIGVRIEDDVIITDNGPLVLSKRIPKEIKEIESLMAEKKSS